MSLELILLKKKKKKLTFANARESASEKNIFFFVKTL